MSLQSSLVTSRRSLYAHLNHRNEHLNLKFKFRFVFHLRPQPSQRMLRSFPRLCKCLWCFSLARPRCFICNETQARKMTKDSIYYLQCQEGECRIIYCEQCWLEMGRRCLACRYRRKLAEAEEEEIALDADDYSERGEKEAFALTPHS
jgi:hypothetical protein